MEVISLIVFGASIAGTCYVMAALHRWLFPGNYLRDELIKELRKEAELWHETAMEYQRLSTRPLRRNEPDEADWWKQN